MADPEEAPAEPTSSILVPLVVAAASVLVIVGLWVRLRFGETPDFQRVLDRRDPATGEVLATLVNLYVKKKADAR